jgi:predicted DNA-binding transcriptional regulator AlpA
MATWDFYDEKILNAIQDFLPQGEEPTVATIQKHLLSMHGPKISRQTIYEHLKKHSEYFPKKGKRGVFVNAEYEMVDKLRNDLPEELKYGYVEAFHYSLILGLCVFDNNNT